MDARVRSVVYDATMREGVPPTADRVAEKLGEAVEAVRASFRSLAEQRMLVLQPSGEILMAGPFSAVPTPFAVSVNGISCFANCIWDALGIPAMLGSNALIDTNCAESGQRTRIRVAEGQLSGEGVMHFVVPARLWWTHIVYT